MVLMCVTCVHKCIMTYFRVSLDVQTLNTYGMCIVNSTSNVFYTRK